MWIATPITFGDLLPAGTPIVRGLGVIGDAAITTGADAQAQAQSAP